MCTQVAGISGKVRIEGEDEEGIYTEAQGKAIIEALGLERRNEVSTYPPKSLKVDVRTAMAVPQVQMLITWVIQAQNGASTNQLHADVNNS